MRASDRKQAHDELRSVIRKVRRRWRMRRLLVGIAATGAAALVIGLLATAVLDRVGDLAPAAPWIRAAAGGLVAIAAAWLLVRPQMRRATDEQVALYLEEHEPSLEAAVLSAVESRKGGAPVSDALLHRTLETAIRRVHAAGDGRFIERAGLARGAAALAAVVLLGAFLGFIPGAGGRMARLLSSPVPAEAAEGVAVMVQPGNSTVSRGADAAVSARLRGFGSELVELAVRTEGDTAFDRLPMAAARDGGFGYILFDLEERTEYFVEAAGVRSPVFVLEVAELPYARRLDLELVYPAYTGLAVEVVPDGGDVAALRGTRVRVQVTPTIPVAGGGIVVDGAAPIPLTADSAAGTLTGEFTVRQDGFYHIVLDGPNGAAVEASPRYVIDAMSDGPPIVSVIRPGRDERATAIDEVFVEARAEDDYGVGSLVLHWSVNGGEEQSEALYGGRGGLKEVSAGRTFYLEEYALEPGDLVSYWVTASDNDGVDGRKDATSDIYFIQIRPFQRDFRAAEQSGMPGGQGEAGGEDGDLSERQRQIIAATFNLVRDSASLSAGDIRENLNTLALSQERLREQVDVLAQRMVARRVTQDTAFRKIAEILPQAAEAMDSAVATLRRLRPGDALPSEQRALQHLQRAEAVFREVQVSAGQQQGGGGGGGGSPNAEDLADLFELELDKLQDQYETVDRGGQSPTGQPELDETMERLQELARRQQREAERRRREAMQGSGTAGGEAQRQLAEQVEEEARRLERLSREQSNPRLQEAARQLQQTAESMRRSAAGGGGEERAVEGLRDARRMLERERGEGLRERAESAARRAEEMAREQERIEAAAEEMLGGGTRERLERGQRLGERKEQQLQELAELQRELRDVAGQAGDGQAEAARRLRDAATAIDETQLRDKIELSRRIAAGGAPDDYVRRLEDAIGEDLDELSDRLRGIGSQFQPGQEQESAETVDRARDLARGLESLRERTRELREQARPGEAPGQQGEPGQRRGEEQGGEQPPQGQQQGQAGDGQRLGAPGQGSGGGGGFGAGAVRQYRNEARERLEDARELRDRLREEGLPTDDVDGLLRGLEELTRAEPYSDMEELVRLQEGLADQAKRVELLVRIRLAGEAGAALFQDGAGAMPAEYRDLIEAYYRSLGRDDGGR